MDRQKNTPKENIFLIGFMGCGKSTISAYLSQAYGMNRLEMDEEIEKTERMSIPDIFARKGEEYFREKETELLMSFRNRKGTVVSCGGGTAMRECNVQEMKRHGKVIWLFAKPETVYERVKNTHNRPLLEGNMNVEYIRSLMEKREPAYAHAADRVVETDGRSAEEICQEIIREL